MKNGRRADQKCRLPGLDPGLDVQLLEVFRNKRHSLADPGASRAAFSKSSSIDPKPAVTGAVAAMSPRVDASTRPPSLPSGSAQRLCDASFGRGIISVGFWKVEVYTDVAAPVDHRELACLAGRHRDHVAGSDVPRIER